MAKRVKLNHCYFETRVYGKYLRVHAIDPHSGLEAIATGLKSMGAPMIRRNAKHKLEYLLTKKLNEAEANKKNKDWIA